MIFTIEELQRLGRSGDHKALIELGKAVLEFDFCMTDASKKYCEHLHELKYLEQALDNEFPMDCPHCGKFYDAPVEQKVDVK